MSDLGPLTAYRPNRISLGSLERSVKTLAPKSAASVDYRLACNARKSPRICERFRLVHQASDECRNRFIRRSRSPFPGHRSRNVFTVFDSMRLGVEETPRPYQKELEITRLGQLADWKELWPMLDRLRVRLVSMPSTGKSALVWP